MGKLFKNRFDLEKGEIYNCYTDKILGIVDEYGYHKTTLFDIYGNKYNYIHQAIIAEGLNLPKHLWPVDENGKRYVVDHIIPIRNGGTDAFDNLHLIPDKENTKNPHTRENFSKARKGRKHSEESKKKMSEAKKGWIMPEEGRKKLSEAKKGIIPKAKPPKIVYQYNMDGMLIKIWDSISEASRNGYSLSAISVCCNGKRKSHKGCIWSFIPL